MVVLSESLDVLGLTEEDIESMDKNQFLEYYSAQLGETHSIAPLIDAKMIILNKNIEY